MGESGHAGSDKPSNIQKHSNNSIQAGPIYVVYGATGPVGTALVTSLSNRHPDADIRAVSRDLSQANSRLSSMALPNVNLVTGDAANAEQSLLLTQNADKIFCAIGFSSYTVAYWSQNWPVVVRNLIAAAKATNAILVFADNLYAYGPGKNVSSSSEVIKPSMTSKPGIRAALHVMLREAIGGGAKVIVVGAADFFGPYAEANSFLGDSVAGRLAAGQKPLALGNTHVLHSFCYVGDFAEALAVASDHDAALGRFWIAPHVAEGKSVSDIASDMQMHVTTEKSPLSFAALPQFVVSLLGVVMPFMREMREMMPWWTADYVVKDDRQQFTEWGLTSVTYKAAVQSTMDYFKARKNK